MSDLPSVDLPTDWMIVKTPRWAATQMAAAFVGLGVFAWWVDWAPVVELGVCLAGAAVALKLIHPERLRVDPPNLEVKEWRAPRRFPASQVTSLQVQTYRVAQPLLFVGTAREDIGPILFIPSNRPAVARLLALLEDPEVGSKLPKDAYPLVRKFVREGESSP